MVGSRKETESIEINWVSVTSSVLQIAEAQGLVSTGDSDQKRHLN